MSSNYFADKTKTANTEAKNIECNNNNTLEILCDGYFYDVTSFISRHPGGSIIKYYTKSGEDATHAIQQFHQRSAERVRMMMKTFKRRPASDHERMNLQKILKREKKLFFCDIFSWTG